MMVGLTGWVGMACASREGCVWGFCLSFLGVAWCGFSGVSCAFGLTDGAAC